VKNKSRKKSSSALSKPKPDQEEEGDINEQIAGIEEDLKGYDISNEEEADDFKKK
jgi:hypothetical protein